MADDDLMTLEDDDVSSPAAAVVTPDPQVVIAAEPAADASTPAAPFVVPPAVSDVPAAAEEPDPEKETDPRTRGVLRDLIAQRKENKALAAKVQQLEPAAQAAAHLAQRLQARPDVLAALQNGTPMGQTPATPAAPKEPDAPEPVLRELAESLTLVGADGRPDLAAAARVYKAMQVVSQQSATAAAKAEVDPLKQERTTERLTARQAEAYDVAKTMEIAPDIYEPLIDGIARSNPDFMINGPTASAALVFAGGLQYFRDKGYKIPDGLPVTQTPDRPATPPAPVVSPQVPPQPVFVEQGGNRPAGIVLSDQERAIAKKTGVPAAAWQKTSERLAALKSSNDSRATYIMEDDE